MLYVLYREKKILEKLTYWSVKDQEPYFSYIEASKKEGLSNLFFPPVMSPNPLFWVYIYHIFEYKI